MLLGCVHSHHKPRGANEPNRRLIGERHYVLAASNWKRFFGLSRTKVLEYIQHNPDFRIVLYRDPSDKDDFYSLSYSFIGHLLTDATLEQKRNRWTGTIIDGSLYVSNSGVHLDVSRFRNDYTDLGIEADRDAAAQEEELSDAPVGQPSHAQASADPPPKKEDPDTHSSQSLLLRTISDRIEQTGAFDFGSDEDARDFKLTSIVYRRGQSSFRRDLLFAYDRACTITGCKVLEVLEAAHIIPYNGSVTNDVRNGLLLRSDIHLLFDLFLLAVEPHTQIIRTSSALVGTEYESLNGTQATMPKSRSFVPSNEALKLRLEKLRP